MLCYTMLLHKCAMLLHKYAMLLINMLLNICRAIFTCHEYAMRMGQSIAGTPEYSMV